MNQEANKNRNTCKGESYLLGRASPGFNRIGTAGYGSACAAAAAAAAAAVSARRCRRQAARSTTNTVVEPAKPLWSK
jgi:hypothetical protein